MKEEQSVKAKTKEELRWRVLNERVQLIAAVEGLFDPDFDLEIGPDLTVRKILSHIIEWDLRSIEDAKRVMEGKEVDFAPDEDNDKFNDAAFEKYKQASTPALVAQFCSSSLKIKTFLRDCSEQELFRKSGQTFRDEEIYPGWFFDDEGHDSGHAAQITAWREKNGL